ncbi:HYR domain-containing protein, partial [Flavobacterium sp. MMLR14_040]|uniref:HYR domain-containing protein n=1 Tax=Flavobacterium sp. MMLR14_040 TaxID=3093843 RepID=UPI00298F704F
MISYNASAQFYTKHYIAPAPWQYFSKANEIVIATNSTATVNITVSKSDGTVITTLTASKGTPAIYRFAGKPSAAPAFAFNTVLNAAGLIVTGSAPISINLRNVASDALGGDGSDQDIKGNAALTSFGDAGIGIRFRVGYYRDGSLGNFNNYGDQRPIYSVMAITNGTTVTIGGVVTATLNAGQSYLFKAAIGTLVETSNPSVMNTSAFIDTPNGCGDGAFNQIPPEAVLGSEYFIERGKGNDTAEQTTVIATKPNTKVIVDTYSVTGALVSTKTTTLATAGSFFTFLNGVSGANFSASRVSADNNVVVYSGTAQSCEVDISTIAPVSECGGSKFIETAKFRNYGTGSLPYFGYVLLKDAVSKVYVNSVDIETKSGVSPRHQLGTTGWYLINFEDTQIGSPDVLSISSDAKLTVSIVQQGGGFSMAGFFSNFAVQPEDPTFSYISGGGCTNSSAMLSTPSGFTPYQWYYNGTAITGANSNTYTATKTGSYSVASTLTCGAQTQSKPVTVTLCTDLGITKTVDKATPCVGSNVEFTLTLSNLGVNNATGVSVNDLLPTGYSFVSSTPSVGSYNSGTGVWSIGDINAGIAVTLKIVAKVNANGVYTNTAIIPASVSDTNSANNSASASTTPNPLPTVIVTNPASVCAPSKVDITVPAITTGSTANLTFSYWTDAAATITYSTPTAATAGTYYIKGTTSSGCSDIKPVVVTTAMAPNAGTLSGTQNICISGTTTFTSNGNSGGSWASSDTAVATVNAQSGLITGIAAGTATITYKVTGTGGCNDANATRNITVNPTPTASVTGVLTSCYNTTLTAVTNTSPAAYVWYKDNLVISGQTASTLVVTADGDYKVKVTNTTTTCENTSAASTVKVSDTQKPTITCPSNVTAVADANSCVATGVILGTPTTTDNCTGTITVTNNAPSSFPIGVNTVTWTAKDVSGNTQTCTQTVTVTDTQKPTITCPSNVTALADANSCVATGVILGTPTTTDNCTGTITVTNNAPSSFPIGVTTVTWTAKDVSGNTQTCTQTVTVTDTQKPTISCPSNVTAVADANSCVATGVILGTPTTTDNCTGTITVTNNAPSSFPIGVTTVTWTAKDVSGNTQTCTQTVTVSDTQKPTITCPSNVTAVADANSCVATGVILGTPTTTDNCTGTITVTNNAPSSFPIGITTVTWTAKDVSGNTQTCTQTVTVSDTQKPTITCPSNVTAVADVNSCVATGVILGTPTTTDNCTGTITVTNNAPSSFPIGVTTVTWTAKDVSGNTQTCTQTVTVTDAQKPTISCPSNVTAVADANSCVATGVILGTPITTDNCTGTITVTNNAPSSFPIGVTTVTWTAKDVSGNTQTCTQTVTVTDAQKPTISCPSNVTAVADANSCVATGIVLGTPTTTDNCTGTIAVTNNAPSSFPIGVTTVTWTAKDVSGNTQTCTQTVKVVGPIKANDDTVSSLNGFSGGVAISNVLSNDLLNCSAVVTSDVNVTLASSLPSVLTFNTTNGSVAVKPQTPAGTYSFDYTICEKSNTTNCSTASVKITVVAPVIDAVTETTTSINGNTGGTTASLTANDTLKGNPVVIGTNPGEVKLTGITVPTGLTLNANGTVTVAANTAAGNYNVEYSICEITNPTNCDTVISVVVVGKPTIDAVTETTISLNGNTGGTTASLTANDTLNGNPVVIGTNPGEVKLTGITVPTGLTLNANGTVT